MKKLVANGHLKRCCDYCGEEFHKGDVYYKDRQVIEAENRYKKFQKHCKHPNKFVHEVWSYIPGECVKQPEHFECSLCGKRI